MDTQKAYNPRGICRGSDFILAIKLEWLISMSGHLSATASPRGLN